MHGESQQLADAQERIRWLESGLACTLRDGTDSRWKHDLELKQLKEEVRSGNQIREPRTEAKKRREISGAKEGRIVGKVKTVRGTTGRNEKVEWSTHKLEQEKSELNERIEEEQISNSRDRENLEEEWKTKLEKENGNWNY